MPSVLEVIDKIEEVGLVVRQNPSRGSHTLWDVVDPRTGTILTGISAHADKTGGDRNWHFQIRRILRKAGFQIEFGREQKRKKTRTGGKRRPAIDLEALKKAQDQAIAAGHRPPLLEDIEGDRDFLTRGKYGNINQFTEEATGEVINDMPTGTDAPRVYATVERLKKCLDLRGPELSKRAAERLIEQHGDKRGLRPGGGVNAEFVRIAMEEVAPQRGLRAWKSVDSGQQTISSVLKAEKPGMSLWTLTLIEATMDHIEGLKWNVIDPDKIKIIPPADVEDIKSKKSEEFEPPVIGPHDPSLKKSEEIATPPQEGPDQTTYDVAVHLVDEYEETLRIVAELAGADGTDPDDWRAVVNKSQAAKNAVQDLRKDYDEGMHEMAAANLELSKLRQSMEQPQIVSDAYRDINPVAEKYATVLLDLLQNFEADKQGNAMLDMIFARLDKLAGF